MTPFRMNGMVVGMALIEPDSTVLDYLKYFVDRFQAEKISFLHVVDKELFTVPLTVIYPELPDLDDEKERSEALNALEKMVKKHWSDSSIDISIDAKVGDPLAMLTAKANEEDSDVVVIGKRKDVDQHMAFSKNIVRLSDAHVLMIPEGASPSINSILVPIDFSDHSKKALETALSIREGLDSKPAIYAMNVYQRPNLMSFKIDMAPEQFEKNIEANHKEGFEKYLAEQLPEYKDIIQPVLVQSDFSIAPQVMEKANELKADFIVMGAKGQSRLASVLLGSTTEAVLNVNESIPTLVVK
jgi:nucleotide-binding universal stress UspA family protein